MKSLKVSTYIQLVLLVLLVLLFWTTISIADKVNTEAVPAQVVAITSSTFSPGEISHNTLRAIFIMRYAKWSDGTPVKVYVYDDSSPIHQLFSKEVLHFFPRQLRQAWDRQVFSGLGQYPHQVDSVEEMLIKVKTTPGSVGYVKIQEITTDVHILQIQP